MQGGGIREETGGDGDGGEKRQHGDAASCLHDLLEPACMSCAYPKCTYTAHHVTRCVSSLSHPLL